MSINLLDMVKGAVSNQVMGQMGNILGQSDSKKTAGMFETAAQSILGGLIKKAGTAEGAREVFKAVQDQDDGILDKLGDILGGNAQQQDHFQKQGGGMLDMIFGNNRGGIMGIIGKFLGLDGSIMGKLMAMAAPIVMGVIGKHIKNKALDAVGLGSFLGEQKSHLGSAMPSALTSQLGFGNLLGNVAGAGKAAAGAVGDAAGAAAGAAGNAGRAAAGAAGDAGRAAAGAAGDAASGIGGLLKLLLPLILIGAAIWFALPYITGAANKAGEVVGDGVSAVGDGVGDMAGKAGEMAGKAGDMAKGAMGGFELPSFDGVDFPEGFDIGGVKDQFSGISKGLGSVTMENAGDLKSKIEGLTGSIDGMGIGDLTGPAKAATGGMIGSFVKTLQGFLSGGGVDGGIMDMLKPAIEALIGKLNPFSG